MKIVKVEWTDIDALTPSQTTGESKSIVIINTPKNCGMCPFRESPWSFCLGEYEKEKHCPLKPLPRKIEVDVKKIEDIMHAEFQMTDVIQDKIVADIKLETDKLIALGYNQCIEEILGGKQ